MMQKDFVDWFKKKKPAEKETINLRKKLANQWNPWDHFHDLYSEESTKTTSSQLGVPSSSSSKDVERYKNRTYDDILLYGTPKVRSKGEFFEWKAKEKKSFINTGETHEIRDQGLGRIANVQVCMKPKMTKLPKGRTLYNTRLNIIKLENESESKVILNTERKCVDKGVVYYHLVQEFVEEDEALKRKGKEETSDEKELRMAAMNDEKEIVLEDKDQKDKEKDLEDKDRG